MTKEALEKEAKTECFMLTVNTIGIDQKDVELAYVMGAEPREKRIAELEKENLVLHEMNAKRLDLQKENDELKSGCGLCYRKDKEQLIKAKEIIKGLLELGSIGDGDYSYVLQADQFIKEIEK